MKDGEVTLRFGGAAGDGIASMGETFAKVCSRSGLHVSEYNSYQSAIRGGHVWLQIRAGEKKMLSQGEYADILVPLNAQTMELHAPEVASGGVVIYNSEKLKIRDGLLKQGVRGLPVPATSTASKYGKNPIMQNVVALGGVIRLLNMNLDKLSGVLQDTFGNKAKAIVDANIGAATAGYDYVDKNFGSLNAKLNFTETSRPVMSGNQATGFGALAAGLKFYAAYPMTPASSILHWLVAYAPKFGTVVKQAEDELAVINMAIGAAHVGARSMVGTSGGGFALMTEAVGQASMSETPVVIVESQRAGPSTGLPTKTEQGDLWQAIGASQGDYPKVIIAPSNVRDCYYAAGEALNIAEKYQIPVIILVDLYLSEHIETIEADDINLSVPIERGVLAGPSNGNSYARYAVTETGVSPRAFPGEAGHEYVATTDEHDEKGIIVSDVLAGIPEHIETRRRQMEKRMSKMNYILKDIPPPRIWGPEDADITLVGWGSTMQVIKEAVLNLGEKGVKANQLHIKYLMPFHAKEVEETLKKSKRVLDVEANYTGQLAKLIRAETGFNIEHRLLKYDGEPFAPRQIVEKALEVTQHA
ncbi:MAG: 2-oxoacid:acceptor oxidoreductase subunit alpha [Thaumarchaeota archaeon]|nr:2-oxoacid:acceptor oxidoreductase subunit alpha [Nitrososphaerota archaeon]